MSATAASTYPLRSMTARAASRRSRSSSSASKRRGRPARVGTALDTPIPTSGHPGSGEGKGVADLVEPDLHLVANPDRAGVGVGDVEQEPCAGALGPVELDDPGHIGNDGSQLRGEWVTHDGVGVDGPG